MTVSLNPASGNSFSRSEMIELRIDKCRRLLRSHTFGRVAFNDQQGLALLPVNYSSDGRHIAIRTDRGSRLTKATQSRVVFEVDEASDQTRSGWSVVVAGIAYEISDTVDIDSDLIRQFPVDSWAPGRKGCWMLIEPTTITGRIVRPATGGEF
jgi:hypothetical protein